MLSKTLNTYVNHLIFIVSFFSSKIDAFHIVNVSLRQKLNALKKIEICTNQQKTAKMSIPSKFLSKTLIGWSANRQLIF